MLKIRKKMNYLYNSIGPRAPVQVYTRKERSPISICRLNVTVKSTVKNAKKMKSIYLYYYVIENTMYIE